MLQKLIKKVHIILYDFLDQFLDDYVKLKRITCLHLSNNIHQEHSLIQGFKVRQIPSCLKASRLKFICMQLKHIILLYVL